MKIVGKGPWKPLSVEEIGKLFRAFRHPWWLAGGYALDTFLGRETRRHVDIDIIVQRKDQLELQAYLHHWQLLVAQKTLTDWSKGRFLEKPLQDVWVKEKRSPYFRFQIMLLDTDGNNWIFKRDDRIGGDISSFGHVIGDIPIIRPEIQLLYKFSKTDYRSKDLHDLDNTLPHLNTVQFDWLQERLSAEIANKKQLKERFQNFNSPKDSQRRKPYLFNEAIRSNLTTRLLIKPKG